MILHICGVEGQGFFNPYVRLLSDKILLNKHKFLLIGKENGKLEKNIQYLNTPFCCQFLSLLNKSDKIIVHNLFNPRLILLLYVCRKHLKKMYWVVWGGDLYSYRYVGKGLKNRVIEHMRKIIIPRFKGVCTLVKGDFDLAKKVYGIKGGFYPAIYVLDKKQVRELKEKSKGDHTNSSVQILLGNSATENNCHMEAFELLKQYKNENIKIICPLSYGDKEYAKKVCKKGKDIFGDKFNPLLEYMPYSEYAQILAQSDVGVFYNDRQQGLGNIYSMLLLGKKLYLREGTSMWQQLVDEDGFSLYSLGNIEGMSLETFREFNIQTRARNQQICAWKNSEEHFFELWEKIFNGY